jgi:hypothetical protein
LHSLKELTPWSLRDEGSLENIMAVIDHVINVETQTFHNLDRDIPASDLAPHIGKVCHKLKHVNYYTISRELNPEIGLMVLASAPKQQIETF